MGQPGSNSEAILCLEHRADIAPNQCPISKWTLIGTFATGRKMRCGKLMRRHTAFDTALLNRVKKCPALFSWWAGKYGDVVNMGLVLALQDIN